MYLYSEINDDFQTRLKSELISPSIYLFFEDGGAVEEKNKDKGFLYLIRKSKKEKKKKKLPLS